MKIEINNLVKSYGRVKALKGINLKIEQGMFGLLGANGAGKTTLMRILTTIIPSSSGEIYIDGKKLNELKEIKNKIGYLPQEFSFYPQLTVRETLDYLAMLEGIKSSDQRDKICIDLLEQVNLTCHKNVKTKALSGGMKRRLGIAQALLNNPALLIVDEPTVGLDPEERVRFRNMLSDLAEDRTVILSTHIVEDIKFTCSRLAVLKEGKLLYSGKVKDMVKKSQGMVWQAEVEAHRLAEIRNKYRVISYLSEGGKTMVRILSPEKPPLQEIERVTPNIEDAYMALMEGEIK